MMFLSEPPGGSHEPCFETAVVEGKLLGCSNATELDNTALKAQMKQHRAAVPVVFLFFFYPEQCKTEAIRENRLYQW